jgi:hypothetical protein
MDDMDEKESQISPLALFNMAWPIHNTTEALRMNVDSGSFAGPSEQRKSLIGK